MIVSRINSTYRERIEMQISVKNIAKILEAGLDIEGLTVIAGYNNMGKSTLLKAIYTVFNTLRDSNKKILTVLKRSINESLSTKESYFDENGYGLLPRELLSTIAEKVNGNLNEFISGKKDNYDLFVKLFKESIEKYKEYWSDYYIEIEIERIYSDDFIRPLYNNIVNICSRDKESVLKYIGEMYIRNVFKGQLNSLHGISGASITVGSETENYFMSISENKIKEMYYTENTEPSVFYIPAYNMLDMLNSALAPRRVYSPEYDIYSMLMEDIKEPTYEEYEESANSTNLIKEIFNEVIHGKLEKQPSGNLFFKDGDLDDFVNIGNVASGMKNFLIIQTLIEKGKLKRNSILLIDEPETNLHPEWHLKFAEILVLMYKNMGIRSIVNSHSPYFIRAIEVKMADHGIKDKGRYYMLSESGKGVFKTQNVTAETDKIYEALYRPLEYL